MGSSKKNKDRDKKKKKRERSRSRERHRHHHKHKKSKRSRDEHSPSIDLSDLSISDVEIEPSRKRIRKDSNHAREAGEIESPQNRPQAEAASNSNDVSLSIEETNKMRIKMGMKPLTETPKPKVYNENKDEEEGEYKAGEEVHRCPENLSEKMQVQKLREKIATQREKRKIKERFRQAKTLGDSDSEEDSSTAWIKKSRQLEKDKQEAEKRRKILDEVDSQFEIGGLIDEEIKHVKRTMYNSNNLGGMKVQHDTTRFEEGQSTVLTLKDSNILDNEEDTLVNVNIVDTEKVEKNLKIKAKNNEEVEYDAPEVDDTGNIVQKTLLTKYDEEIVGEKRDSFRIGSGGAGVKMDELSKSRKVAKLRQLQSLSSNPQLAREYLDPSETVSFKKVKRKKKKTKMFKADELEPLDDESHHGSRSTGGFQPASESPEKVDSSDQTLSRLMAEEDDDIEIIPMDVDESMQEDVELTEAIARSRRIKQGCSKEYNAEDLAKPVSNPNIHTQDLDNMTLNLTDEFCRTLGEIPTYGLAGNRADEETAILQAIPVPEEQLEEKATAWEEVGIDDTKVEINNETAAPILEEEPSAGGGVAMALALAKKKGYLEKDNSNKAANAALQHLRAVHYSIDDKANEEDRRSGRGDRYMGPAVDFREKDGYKPDVKLEYVDDEGRKLNSKEAFRYLSHKFHGKGSGKNKLEKRMKKWQEESLMQHMSSSDTPLQTLEKQKEKQKQMGSAYLVLSGNKSLETLDVKK